jgi:hypothetical protein
MTAGPKLKLFRSAVAGVELIGDDHLANILFATGEFSKPISRQATVRHRCDDHAQTPFFDIEVWVVVTQSGRGDNRIQAARRDSSEVRRGVPSARATPPLIWPIGTVEPAQRVAVAECGYEVGKRKHTAQAGRRSGRLEAAA